MFRLLKCSTIKVPYINANIFIFFPILLVSTKLERTKTRTAYFIPGVAKKGRRFFKENSNSCEHGCSCANRNFFRIEPEYFPAQHITAIDVIHLRS